MERKDKGALELSRIQYDLSIFNHIRLIQDRLHDKCLQENENLLYGMWCVPN